MTRNALPLFPLNVVLFPGMELPLHVFEDRYKLLVERCLVGTPEFGVVLIRRGQEVGGPAEPYEVGTIARIEQLTRLEDGRLNLTAVGRQRFRIQTLYHDEPYLTGDVDLLNDAQDPALPPEALARVQRLFARHLELIGQAAGRELPPVEMPSEPRPLSYFIAANMRAAANERQYLLAMPTAVERLQAEAELLAIENDNLRILLATQGPISH